MDLREDAAPLVGDWSGHNRLWLGPEEPVRESSTDATLTMAAGRFLVITYTWSDKGKPQDGVLILRIAPQPGPFDMVWVDSFHTMGEFMRFEGRPGKDGAIEGTTKWSPGSGPDWGWRIAVSSTGREEFSVRMYIETPDGEEAPAVESIYSRRATAA